MRLILILVVVLGGFGFCAVKTAGWFAERKAAGIKAEAEAAKKKAEAAEAKLAEARQTQDLAPMSSAPGDLGQDEWTSDDVRAIAAVQTDTIGSYQFKNRLVPEAPDFLRGDNTRLIVERDDESNSWVWMGSRVLASQIVELAEAYDRRQMEMDLEFCMVLISAETLKSRGLSVFWNPRASWMDSLELTGDAGSLRLGAGNWGVELGMGSGRSGVSVVSQPIVRCIEGEGWSLKNDAEVPVPRSEVVDGVIRQSLEYRAVGFGLEGVVRIVGDDIVLNVEQRNGSVVPGADANSVQAPTLASQSIKTAVRMGFWEWSVLGGIQVEREEIRKGLFRSSVSKTDDFLVIFVRPRLALEAPPRAVPVHSLRNVHPLESPSREEIFGGRMVLPARESLPLPVK